MEVGGGRRPFDGSAFAMILFGFPSKCWHFLLLFGLFSVTGHLYLWKFYVLLETAQCL